MCKIAFIIYRVEYNFFLARILQYPSLGNLYLIIDPSYPFNATIRLYNSVLPLVVPTVEFHLKDYLMRYILPSSRMLFLIVFILVLSLQLIFCMCLATVLIMCCVDVIRPSDIMLQLSRDSRYVIKKLKPHRRIHRIDVMY